jgi:diamine N-acetyltransferase
MARTMKDDPGDGFSGSSAIQGSRVALRPAALQDRRAVFEWGHTSDIARWVNLPPEKAPTFEEFSEGWKDYFYDGPSRPMGRVFVIERDGRPVGMIAYNDIDNVHRRSEIDIWLSCEESCGHGYGPDAVMALMEFLQREFDLQEVWAQPSERNPRSIRAFEKAGFTRLELETKADFLKYGPRDYEDSVLMVKRLEEPGT